MAARLAAPTQDSNTGTASPNSVRELIVIPELSDSIQLQHAIHQVSSTVVEVNGDSSGHSSPSAEQAHTYITVASEGGNGVNYHVQYVEPQEIYTQAQPTHMETIRTYPVYGVTTVGNGTSTTEATTAESTWTDAEGASYTAYGVVVAGAEANAEAEADAPASPAACSTPQQPRMPPATVQWLLDNYETAEGVSLPRSTLYAHYLRHCATHRLEPVNAASFGKLIRSVFVGLRTRRLGTRGNSKYHYYGIRAKPHAIDTSAPETSDDGKDIVEHQEVRVREAREGNLALCAPIAHRQYLGSVEVPEPPELTLVDLPADIPLSAVDALRRHHREHGLEFLDAVAVLDTSGVERARRAFWRRPPAELCRRVLCKLCSRRDVAAWLRRAELQLYQRAVELLLPSVLRSIPSHLTQAIRNFAKSLETALAAGAGGAPAIAARAQASAAAAMAAALRRYTSLNHLAQAARAVLTNTAQIQQMLSDLNRVDFRVVREQAAWACSCGTSATVHRLEADFKATLGRGASLEQWAEWLEGCVVAALAPHEQRADYTARARRLLLDWSFYSSLVIRELTLRSAASFGSFHLIRLLFDEYVSYLIERRVAEHQGLPPIAVMQRLMDEEEETPPEESPRVECDDDELEWEWADDDEEDDDPVEAKRSKLTSE